MNSFALGRQASPYPDEDSAPAAAREMNGFDLKDSLIPYPRNPYDGYEQAEDLMFPVTFRAAGFLPKERVLGIKLGGEIRAYPFASWARPRANRLRSRRRQSCAAG